MQSRYGICPILALNDGLLVHFIPVLKLGVQLDGDDLRVARVMIPGEIAVHTHHIHIGCLYLRRGKYVFNVDHYLKCLHILRNFLTKSQSIANRKFGGGSIYFLLQIRFLNMAIMGVSS